MENEKQYTPEKWAVIDDYPKYEISNRNYVRETKTGKLLSSYYVGRDLKVNLKSNDGETHRVSVKKIMTKAFCGWSGEEYKIYFKDGNGHNLHADNLGWKHGPNKSKYTVHI